MATMALTLLVASGVALAVTEMSTHGPDTLIGTNAADNLPSKGGKDKIFGLWGNGNLLGGSDKDVVVGGNEDLRFLGGDKNVLGGSSNDWVLGGLGSDNLVGGGGNDFLGNGPFSVRGLWLASEISPPSTGLSRRASSKVCLHCKDRH